VSEAFPLQRAIPKIALLILAAVALLVFVLLPAAFSGSALAVWVSCLGLYLLACLPDDGHSASFCHVYRGLSVIVLLLIQGVTAALFLQLVGHILAFGLRLIMMRRYTPQDYHLGSLAESIAQAALQTAAATLVGWGLYQIFNGPTPLTVLSPANSPALVIMLLAYSLVSHGIRYFILTRLHHKPYEPIWAAKQRPQLFTELTVLPLIVLLPVILHSSGATVYLALMLVIMAAAIYQYQSSLIAWQSGMVYRQSADLVRKLALVNQSAQNAMFRVDQELALQTVCQTAASVAQAERAAIFIADRESDSISLVEGVGLSEAERAAGYHLHFPKQQFAETGSIVVHDTQLAAPRDPLAVFSRPLQPHAFAEIPLRSGDALLGYLAVYHNHSHQYSKIELELLDILANRIAASLDNAHLLDTLEFHAFEMTHLVHLSRISTASLKLNQVAADVTGVLRQMTAMDWAMIALLDESSGLMEIIGFSGYAGLEEVDTLQFRLPQFAEVIALRNQEDPRLRFLRLDEPGLSPGLKDYMANLTLRSLVIAPMIVHQSAFGMIFLGTTASRSLSERESQLIEAATNQVATQIYNAQLYHETYNTLRRQLEQTALIRDIVQRISSSRDFNAIIQDVFDAAVKTTQADRVELALLTESDNFWVIEQTYDEQGAARQTFVRPKDGDGIGEVMRTAEILLSNNLPDAAAYRSLLAVPLLWDNGVEGVLSVNSQHPEFFKTEQADFLKNLGSHTIISIQNERLVNELEYQVDVLTNLRELSLTLSTVLDTPTVARKVIATAMAMLNSQYAAIFQCGPQRRRPTMLLEQISEGAESITTAQSIVVADLAQQVASSGSLQSIHDASSTYAEQLPSGVRYIGLVAAPIKRGAEVYQVLCLGFTEEHDLSSRELNTLSLLTAQASAHLENAGLHEEIHDVNSRLRAILDSTRDGVILLDERGRIIEVNPAAQRLMGINLSEYVHEPLANVLLQYTETTDEGQAGYSREELTRLARITRLSPQGITRREFTRTVNPKQTLYIEEIGSPVIDEHNHMIGRLMVLRDITEEKRLEEYRTEIASMAVHDLRAPLASIINALQIAAERIDTPTGIPVVKRTIDLSLTNADDMMAEISTLLDIRKGREMTLERLATSIEQILELSRLRLMPSAEKANITIDVVLSPNLPDVYVDPAKIGRVLQNLIDNAIRFTPAGKSVQISVDYWGSKRKLLVRVADSGPGIPEKDQSKVFDQYWQSKENKPLRGTKGSGIGLAFCKLALEAHGERIWVEPVSPLPGACFAFTLPLA
jgi:two-component system, NtrC family, sensor histidine kinase KinB